jgi:hypothetical protein
MTVGLAVAYALLIITHIFTALLFSLVLIGYGLYLAVSTGRPQQTVRLGLAVVLGVALSAFYLVPALAHERNIPASRLIELRLTSHFEGNFLFARPEWTRNTGLDHFLWKISWTTITAFLITLAGLACLLLQRRVRQLRDALFWVMVALASLAMMLPVSTKLWETIPALAALQFPWRFNITLTLAAAAVTGLATENLDIRRISSHVVIAAGIAALLLVWLGVDFKSARRAWPWTPETKKLVAGDYLSPAWAKWTASELLTVDGMAVMDRRLEADEASGLRYIRPAGARSAIFEAHSTNQWLTLRRFFYPGLTARTSSGQNVELRPTPVTGLIDIKAPEGVHRILLSLPWSVAEKAGLSLTILAALVAVSVALSSAFRPGMQ